ncbi:glutamate synthase subunit beta [Portibacter lacus]|uniref:Dihydropyrimidine dehydrogenase subunit A n=1 Tax=Portibacter lacus TaxID=1099794 RepID=A0AA37SQC7_9BACT|nr:glutamate synthase subunit beta [Portibacter lacus]GLR17812.1 dihydropyrimidine dehydrogenase subunit A [Portibacter lacus]
MGDIKGFIKYNRELPESRDPKSRINDYKEIYKDFSEEKTKTQAARCMDCGVPFCHNGCPLGNNIPAFNDAVYKEDWEKAFHVLNSTNNFPEFTGRICPAPCEQSCVLGINNDPVTIELVEKSIAEKAFENGWVVEEKGAPTGQKVAVVGSGPAGLAAASQLLKAGHEVTVYERSDRIGGLLRYGIPDFKLEKDVVSRRVDLMREAGVKFEVNANVGGNIKVKDVLDEFDAVILAGGSTIPRDLKIPGRDLKGVHFAMEFLEQQNKRVQGDQFEENQEIFATDKNVVVIGGGDTGSDCVGTSNRHRAASVTQIELMSKPPEERDPSTPWPLWPMQLRTSSSHEEGAERHWAINTKEFIGDGKGNLKGLKLVDLKWEKNPETGRFSFEEVEGSDRIVDCELALLAVGFIHPQYEGMLSDLKLEMTDRGNVKDEQYKTSLDKVFVAGDMRRGQSLVVWAIAEGREAAIEVDKFLQKESALVSNYHSPLFV